MAEFDDVLEVRWNGGTRPDAGHTRCGSGAIDAGWAIGAAVNGGALMALGAQALSVGLEPSGHADILTWSAFFLTRAQPGTIEIEVEVLRRGRSVSTGQVRLLQRLEVAEGEGEIVERVRMIATLGDAGRGLEPVHRVPEPVALPDPKDCLPVTRDSSPQARAIALLDRLDVRIDPATAGFAAGRPSGRGVIRAWLRMADGRDPDVAMLPLAVDALMPVSFDLGAPGWAPTVELTGQVLGRPAPGWLRVELRTDTVVGSFYVEDCRVWDSTGRLVARSRQLAGLRMPSG